MDAEPHLDAVDVRHAPVPATAGDRVGVRVRPGRRVRARARRRDRARGPGVAAQRGFPRPAGGRGGVQREEGASVAGPVTLPRRVTIREVGPRDGLQSEAPLAVEERARLIEALSATGLPKIEAVSFVSPKAVPAMAGAADVWARVSRSPDVAYSALVPNRR